MFLPHLNYRCPLFGIHELEMKFVENLSNSMLAMLDSLSKTDIRWILPHSKGD